MKSIKKKYIFGCIFVIAIMVGAIVAITNKKDNSDELDRFGYSWTDDYLANTYFNNIDFDNNICNIEYYSPYYDLVDNKIYDISGQGYYNDVFSMFSVSYSKCSISLLFYTAYNGNFYYVNNFKNEYYEEYERIKINNLSYIVNVVYDEVDNVIKAYDRNEQEYILDDYIKESLSIKFK